MKDIFHILLLFVIVAGAVSLIINVIGTIYLRSIDRRIARNQKIIFRCQAYMTTGFFEDGYLFLFDDRINYVNAWSKKALEWPLQDIDAITCQVETKRDLMLLGKKLKLLFKIKNKEYVFYLPRYRVGELVALAKPLGDLYNKIPEELKALESKPGQKKRGPIRRY